MERIDRLYKYGDDFVGNIASTNQNHGLQALSGMLIVTEIPSNSLVCKSGVSPVCVEFPSDD